MQTYDRLGVSGIRLGATSELLHAVRYGVIAVWTVAAMAAAVALPPLAERTDGALVGAAVVAAVAAGVADVLVRRWQDLSRRVEWTLMGWAVLNVALITLAVARRGGLASDLAYLYVLPVVYYLGLTGSKLRWTILGATLAGFGLALWSSPAGTPTATLLVVTGVVAVAAMLTMELAHRLQARGSELVRATRLAERRAQCLATTVVAARRLASLHVDEIYAGLLRSVTSLGIETGVLCYPSPDGERYRVAEGIGVPVNVAGRDLPIGSGMAGEALRTGHAVHAGDYASDPRAVPELVDERFGAVSAVPIVVDDTTQVVLVAATRRARELTDDEQEAIELLALQAGLALRSALEHEAEHTARRRLEELERAKDDFISTAAHELRTPTTVVYGMSDLLRRRWPQLDDDVRQRLLERVHHHAEDLRTLVERLSTYRELDAGVLEPDRCDTDVREVVDDVLDRLDHRRERYAITTQVPAQLWLRVDRTLLHRALSELVDNALRHNPPGTAVRIVAERAPEHVVLTVEDDGQGLDTELDPAVDRFRRGGEVLTRSTRGVGIGLAFVAEVARVHDGRLDLASQPGSGTRATIALPSRAQPAARRTAAAGASSDAG